jgi:hypothetical protein
LVGVYLGTPTGLATQAQLLTNYANDVGGDSRNISMRSGDINGDGRADLLLINDNIVDPKTAQSRIAYAASPRNVPFAAPVQDSPDLLRTIDNGLRGTRGIEYRLAGDFAQAVAPTALGCNGAAEAPPRTLGHRRDMWHGKRGTAKPRQPSRRQRRSRFHDLHGDRLLQRSGHARMALPSRGPRIRLGAPDKPRRRPHTLRASSDKNAHSTVS